MKKRHDLWESRVKSLDTDVSTGIEEICDQFKELNKFITEHSDGIPDPWTAYTMSQLYKMIESYGEILEAFADKMEKISDSIDCIYEEIARIADKD